jgi:filamentous hemagglutinin
MKIPAQNRPDTVQIFATLLGITFAGGLFSPRALAATLPVPCATGSCGKSGPTVFVSSGTATAVQSGNTLSVQQASDKAILNWATFDISADGKVIFNQPSASSIALNRIFQGNPSSIFGQVTANGQIYLINQNGFLFGSSARVNVGGLIASSLNISDSTFNAGLLSPQLLLQSQAALQSDGRTSVLDNSGNPVLDANGNPVPVQVQVAAGAQITAATGGRILLASPTVANAGDIQAPDGQIVLAAGQKVYLQASNDPGLRGLVVEVDQGGKAWNQLTGSLSAPRGNISLVGLSVNQDGRISASTSVSANGSVRLEAADTVTFSSGSTGTSLIAASNGGTVELGSNSSIDILPELTDSAKAVVEQTQLASQVNISAQQVFMHGGEITAPGGNLNVVASSNPGAGVQVNGNPNARIRIDAGTHIDLAGSDAELPMSANLVSVQLRANELADDPTQRNGALRGQTVVIDSRVGTTIANVQSAIDAVPQSVAQRTSAGGHASFQSEGDIVFANSAAINVSGGATTFDAGIIQTTQLVGANGQLYDIGNANPLLTYSGVLNPTFTQTFNKWGVQEIIPTPGIGHYEAGYTQGAAAGSVQFAASSLVLDGTLVGHVTNGPFQRTPATAQPGGILTIGLPKGLPGNGLVDFLSPAVSFTAQSPALAISDNAPYPVQSLQLTDNYIVAGGFTRTAIYGDTTVSIPAGLPLNLGPGGSLLIDAPRVDVLSNVTALGGSIQIDSVATTGLTDPHITRPGVLLGDGVTFDVRGQWTNDALTLLANPTAQLTPTWQNGGSISLTVNFQGSELVLGNEVSLRTSGGAWIGANRSVTGGSGGQITLSAGPLDAALQIGEAVSVDGFGAGSAAGGTFSLTAARITVAQGTDQWTHAQLVDDSLKPGGAFEIDAPLFSNFGFSNVDLTASAARAGADSAPSVLNLQAGTQIVARTRSLELNPGYLSHPTGGVLSDFAQVATLPDAARPVENVAFNVVPQGVIAPLGSSIVGRLDIEAGSSIVADPGAKISLSGVGGILVDGTLRAPAGFIQLSIPTPDTDSDAGFLPGLSIEVGSHGILDTSGVAQLVPTDNGQRFGKVLGGGSIDFLANRGSVITDTGSLLDIAGTQAALDLADAHSRSGYASHVVASAAGSILIQAPESVSLLGSIQASAGAGDTGQPPGGSLEVDLTRSRIWFFLPSNQALAATFPTTPRVVELVTDSSGFTPVAANTGLGVIGVAGILNSGLDALRIEAGDQIDLMSTLPLHLARNIILDSPAISVGPGVAASLAANYVSLGNSLPAASGAQATSGTGTLNVSAQQIDILGSTVLQGVSSTVLNSGGDIQLRGSTVNGLVNGNLTTASNLELDAARVYPATATPFEITVLGSGNTLTIGQTSPSPGTPLSAGGSITLTADQIVNAGTLLAPFGSIDLSATSSITLASGSVTSVSGAGLLIPFGTTELGGLQWFYNPANAQPQVITGVPNREIQLGAPKVSIASSSTVDLRGGGDLYAYEWVPGTGGSKDALAANVVPGLYAVLPSLQGQYAPFDPQESGASNLQPGASVYLSGGNGLAAGIYPLLPARYGLLPGAFLVQVQAGYPTIAPGQNAALPDGTPVVAGYFTSGSTGLRDPLYSAFTIWTSSYAREIAGYQDTFASSFFNVVQAAGQPPPVLPADAGRLSITVGTALQATGNVLSQPAKGGRAASIDVSASNLEITGTSGPTQSDAVELSAAVVQGWGAGQLVLGGQPSSDGSSIQVNAESVTIGAGAQLSADQIILVAGQSIDLQPGSKISSTSGASSSGSNPTSLLPVAPITLSGSQGSGAALLAVSDISLPEVIRTAGAGSASQASVTLEAGSSLSSRGALSLVGPAALNLAGTVSGQGASWSLASGSIGFVGQGQSTDTLQINTDLLSALQSAGSLRLASAGAINLFTPVALGAASASQTPSMTSLTLMASAINNVNGNDALFAAKTLTLNGLSGGASVAPASGSGALTFNAGELDLGPGTLLIQGFGSTDALVSGAIVGRGAGGIGVGGDLSLTSSAVTAASGSQTQISATGNLQVLASGAAPSLPPMLLGGTLTLAANNVNVAGSVIVPAGVISIQAAQDFELADGAVINAGGAMVHAVDQAVGAAGGTISIAAGRDLSLNSSSLLNVAGAGDSAAGQITLSSAGTATIQSTLVGGASAGNAGGSFSLDANRLAGGLTALANNLQAGGFNDQLSVRVRAGDLNLSAGSALTANNVRLTADSGTVTIAGVINADAAALRGQIGLFGGLGVELASTGELHADSSGAQGRGGEITLGAGSGGILNLDSGGVVTASGNSQAGELLLQASATTNDIAIGNFGADVSRAGSVVIQPVLRTSIGSAPSSSDLANILTGVSTYMGAAAPTIASRLNPGASTAIVIRPIAELDSNGPVSLSQTLDLTTWRFDGQPVDLTLRGAGSITVNGTISDGFVATRNSLNRPTVGLMSGPSSSIHLVAGADLSSADTLALAPNSAADLTLAPSAVIRTGTGDIDLAASRDVVFSGSGSAVYTAGIAGASAINVPRAVNVFNFPEGGGNLSINAGRDVVGAPVTQSVSAWQLRQGISSPQQTAPAQWGVDFAKYGWNIGTLGGGDLSVSAGRDALNVSAAAGDSMVANSDGTQTHFNGGGLVVSAGRDIGSGQFYAAQGTALLTAGGSFSAVRASPTGSLIGSLIAMGDAQVSIQARGDINIEGIVNPSILLQPAAPRQLQSGYFTYGEDSSLRLQSTSGTVSLVADLGNLRELLGQAVASGPGVTSGQVYPATLVARALQGDIVLGGVGATLFPSDSGQLELFAGRDIDGQFSHLTMSDALPATVVTPSSPGPGSPNPLPAFASGRHSADSQPALITAGRDINDLELSVPKPARILAGQDISNLTYFGQNLATSSLTLVSAGRDFVDGLNQTGATVEAGGPGQVDILAGRNVDLGFSAGLTTIGNLNNPNLNTSVGSALTVLAGLGQSPDFADFLKNVISPSTTYQQQLINYVQSQTGQTNLAFAQADPIFTAFSVDEQRPLIDSVFFNELLLSGREANATPKVGFSRGYAAIDALFPGSRTASNPYQGDLTLAFSRIYTLGGGNIDLFAPGGLINVGLANPPASLASSRSPSQLGIVAQGAGDVNIFSRGDVLVNQSRIFTLGGGNILIWSNEGSIDAGRGSKSAVSAPPPEVLVDAQGNVTLSFSGAVAGSGIRTIQVDPQTPPGNVDLVAPQGTVNAGDAGIGAAGNINIAAQAVIGLDNIQFGGTSVGVPSTISNIGAALAGASNAASSTTNATTATAAGATADRQAAAALGQGALAWLDVFVTGLGEENCKPDDIACLKRQKAPAR